MTALNDIVKGIVIDKACSIKADKDSSESKTINLKIVFDGVPLQDVFAKAVSSAVIQWQNGPGRSKFDTWTNGQTVEVSFKSPGVKIKTREDKIQELVNSGMDEKVATFAIDHPEKFAAIVNNVSIA